MILAQLSIAPVGKGTSLSKYVKIAINALKNEPVNIENNAMATVIEAEDLDTLFKAVQRAHNAVVESGAQRIITELKIDDRRDKKATISSKLESIR